MKRIFFSLLALSLVAVSCTNAPTSEEKTAQNVDNGKEKVAVVVHRGDWRNAPENSILAIENAIKMGGDMVEIDLKMTKDSVLILMHDTKIDRTVSGKGKPSDYTYAEIQEMNLRNAMGRVTYHKVPTFEEAMLAAKGKIQVNVDKGWDYFKQVKEILEKTGTMKQVLIKSGATYQEVSSADNDVLKSVTFMPIVNANKENALQIAKDYIEGMHPMAFEVCYSEYNEDVQKVFDLILESGSKLWINSLWASLCGGMDDDIAVEQNKMDECYGRILDFGATYIQTDRPAELIEYLKSKGQYIETKNPNVQ